MSTQPNPQHPRQSNAYMIGSQSMTDMVRLIHLDHCTTKAMRCLLPENLKNTNSRILDIACGPGSWVLKVASTYKTVTAIGVDICQAMIDYAKAQAYMQQLDNAIFEVMDITEHLHFPDNYFDFVNARFLAGFMTRSLWPEFLAQCLRVTRIGGYIRLTEADDFGTTTSSSLEKLNQLYLSLSHRAERNFFPEGHNLCLTPRLSSLLRTTGYKNIEKYAYIIDFSAGTEDHKYVSQNWLTVFKLMQPSLIQMELIKQEEADILFKQMQQEVDNDEFCAFWNVTSILGCKTSTAHYSTKDSAYG